MIKSEKWYFFKQNTIVLKLISSLHSFELTQLCLSVKKTPRQYELVFTRFTQ